jgi:hypothetical protein
MTLRVASRLVLLLAVLGLATALTVAAMALLAGGPALVELDQVAAVERASEAPAQARQATEGTPPVAFVFAGIVLLAAVPPLYQVYVYRRPAQVGGH